MQGATHSHSDSPQVTLQAEELFAQVLTNVPPDAKGCPDEFGWQ